MRSRPPDRPAPESPLELEIGVCTDPGRVRETNEDFVLAEDPASPRALQRGALAIVAHGIGGHAAGEVASRLAAITVHGHYYGDDDPDPAGALRRAIEIANEAVREHAAENPDQSDLGSTLTAAVMAGGLATIGQVGDSHAYLIREQAIVQLTTDHTWVAEQVAAGVLSPEQAQSHPERSRIRRALGARQAVEVDIVQQPVQAGDVLVLCSDGLTAVVAEAEIARIATRQSAPRAAVDLIRLANQRGAPDNVSAAVIRVLGPAGSLIGSIPRKWIAIGAAAGALLLLGVLIVPRLSGAPAETPRPAPTVLAQSTVQPATASVAAAPLLAHTPTVVPATPTPAPTSVPARPSSARVAVPGAFIRESASLQADRLGQVALGTTVQVLDQDPNGDGFDGSTLWYQVRVSDNLQGWMHSKLFDP